MNRRILLLLFITITGCCLYGQQRMRIMEYNVENLFDTLHTSGLQDEDFTPAGIQRWNAPRYWGKLGRLTRVIAAAGGQVPVDLVALVEIENDSVVYDLTRRTRLRRLEYDYVTATTADVRGMRVALLYQPARFNPISHSSIRFAPPSNRQHPTRDALHVAGELVTGDTLDIIVCHWPSRRGGRASMRYRNSAGERLRAFCDSLTGLRERAAIVITGDFNAWYPESCLRQELGVRLPNGTPPRNDALYLLSHRPQGSDGIRGTYKYQGEWNRLDHFIVNGLLLHTPIRPNALHTSPTYCRIADFPFLLQKEKSGKGVRPYRTYLGTFYQGGYSDHLPLILDLFF